MTVLREGGSNDMVDSFGAFAARYGYLLVAFVIGGGVWWYIAPYVVRKANPRLRRRNPSHYHRLVNFYRAWGIAAVILGIVLVFALGTEGFGSTLLPPPRR